MTELKPCPFCGDDMTLTIHIDHTNSNYIMCICGARMQFSNYDGMPGQTLDELLQKWNGRVRE